MGGAARSIGPSLTDSNKKLNAYAAPFVPGFQVPPPVISYSSPSMTLTSPPPAGSPLPPVEVPLGMMDPQLAGSLTKFDEPTPFVYQGHEEAKV